MHLADASPEGYAFEAVPEGPPRPPTGQTLTDEEGDAVDMSVAAIADLATAMRLHGAVTTSYQAGRMRLAFGPLRLVLTSRRLDRRTPLRMEIARRGKPTVEMTIPVRLWCPGPAEGTIRAAHVADLAKLAVRSYLDIVQAHPITPGSPGMTPMRDAAMAHVLRLVESGRLPVGTPSPSITATPSYDGEPGTVVLRFGAMRKGMRLFEERDGLTLLPPAPSEWMLDATVKTSGSVREASITIRRPQVTVLERNLPSIPSERIRLMRMAGFDDLPMSRPRSAR